MRVALLLTAALLLLSAPASAASVLAWDVATLTQRSTRVVEARVDSVRSERLPDGDIRTVNRVTVSGTLKGEPAATLEIVQGSGRVGDIVKTIHGDMELVAGERYVLFLAERGGELHSTLLAWSVFRLDGDGDDASLQRNLAGLDLRVRADDGSLRAATDLDLADATPSSLGVLRRDVAAAR